jgi:hypothetical protein
MHSSSIINELNTRAETILSLTASLSKKANRLHCTRPAIIKLEAPHNLELTFVCVCDTSCCVQKIIERRHTHRKNAKKQHLLYVSSKKRRGIRCWERNTDEKIKTKTTPHLFCTTSTHYSVYNKLNCFIMGTGIANFRCVDNFFKFPLI